MCRVPKCKFLKCRAFRISFKCSAAGHKVTSFIKTFPHRFFQLLALIMTSCLIQKYLVQKTTRQNIASLDRYFLGFSINAYFWRYSHIVAFFGSPCLHAQQPGAISLKTLCPAVVMRMRKIFPQNKCWVGKLCKIPRGIRVRIPLELDVVVF